ncbi:uncharacterized protein FA14DRAFT_178548 [Meira miltonrushii]|uniref:Uncharacterized protein n=1 Tax=Meira miltonrushii TaxID=1280837 RepID=A0A316VC83_9BASI|nr:uncharacterized protein FA14DRAFT_178548 [Meira miltonrushii]PWN35172.1 hypothetical protein FA14DRAFT_178548 [Meira miltonrushii]
MNFLVILLPITLAVLQTVRAAEQGHAVMGYPAHTPTSPPRRPRVPSGPQPENSMRKKVWEHWETQAERSSNAARQKTVALTLAGHTAIGMAKPVAKYACQTALCADPSHKEQTEQDIKTRLRIGKAAVRATLDKTERDFDYSKDQRKTHFHNYREVKKAEERGENVTPEFREHYSAEKNQLEKQ